MVPKLRTCVVMTCICIAGKVFACMLRVLGDLKCMYRRSPPAHH